MAQGGRAGFVAALGAAQIVSWGCLYYGFSLFVLPMQAELGWSLTALNGALTTGLLVAGLCALPAGMLLDRVGGRSVMTAGSLLAAVLLVAWSRVDGLGTFYFVWAGIGVSMAAVLYEPVFIVLTHEFGEDARLAITRLTLIAGFASTVFMPLIEWLLVALPWRDVLLLLAAIVLLVTVPVHGLLISPRGAPPRAAGDVEDGAAAAPNAGLAPLLRRPVFWGLTLWFTAYAGTASGLMFQFVPHLKAGGVDSGTILIAVALVGPSQVAGRFLLMLTGDRLPIVAVGAFTTTALPAAVLLLMALPPTTSSLCAFAILFGIANGISTILRGTAPAAWLGRDNFGRMMGAMGTPMMIVAALAPLATAAIWSATGSVLVMHAAVLTLAVSGAAGFWLAVLARRRRRA
ncbi:MAG: MFS transporter [Gammaproteobacteria bacterium]